MLLTAIYNLQYANGLYDITIYTFMFHITYAVCCPLMINRVVELHCTLYSGYRLTSKFISLLKKTIECAKSVTEHGIYAICGLTFFCCVDFIINSDLCT